MTDAPPPHPRFYLEQAAAAARNIRAWIGRQGKPQYAGYTSSQVPWVTGVLDELDRTIAGAVRSADHHLPNTLAHTERQRRDERARSGLNLHQLKAADKDRVALADWAHKIRWSSMPGQLSGDELDHLDVLIRSLRDHLSHLMAQAQDEELAR